MKPIIRIENLSKQYRISARQTPAQRDSLSNAAAARVISGCRAVGVIYTNRLASDWKKEPTSDA